MFDSDIDLEASRTVSLVSLRKKLQDVLGTDAEYLRILQDSKAPAGSFVPGRRNRLKNIPKVGNFGIIPQGRLFILDFDCHSVDASSIDEQIDFFSKFLEVNIRESFSVVTQSGGIHVYLRFPETVENMDTSVFPKASLRGYSDAFSKIAGETVHLDTDIRSGMVNGYAIGPTSSVVENEDVLHENYWIADGSVGFTPSESFDILSISVAAVDRFRQVVQMRDSDREVKRRAASKSAVFDEAPGGFENAFDSDKLKVKPDSNVIRDIGRSLERRGYSLFHAKRAFVKAALHCCYDDYNIAIVCLELGIDKDSHTGKSIGFRGLMIDLSRFKPASRYHSIYCEKGKRGKNKPQVEGQEEGNGKSLEENLLAIKEKIKSKKNSTYISSAGTRRVNPRVVDPLLVSKALMGGSKKVTQQYLDAMAVFDHFIQPLTNVGANRVLLAKVALMDRLNINESRATQALRILRDRGVIEVAQHQRTGLAPSYAVSESFINRDLTKALRISWAFSGTIAGIGHVPIYFNRLSCSFMEVFANVEVVSPRSLMAVQDTLLSSRIGGCEAFVGAGAATTYLREEAAAMGLVGTSDGVVVLATGEVS